MSVTITPGTRPSRPRLTARFWLSWHQPTDDFRPLTDPPNAAVLGWWCSGYDADDTPILCALVSAVNTRAAKQKVRLSWPEAPSARREWRIEQEQEPDWLPGDRFPLSDWMQKRCVT